MRHTPTIALSGFIALLALGCRVDDAKTPTGSDTAVAPPTEDLMVGTLPGDLIPAFAATVRRGGVESSFDSRATGRTAVYVINSSSCPSCEDSAAAIVAVETAYMPRNVDVVHVYPNRGETAAENIAWHAAKGFTGGQILDVGGPVSLALEAEVTPTVYVVGADGVVVYRGAIEDSGMGGTVHFLADALAAHLEGLPVIRPVTDAVG